MAENILNHAQFDAYATALEADRGLPPGTLRAVAKQESNGNPNAVSNKGAKGAFQFIPATAKAYNVDVSNPWDSMRGAADYLGDNMQKYGRIDAALADYNGGPSQAQAVLKSGKPTYKETQNYVTSIAEKIANAVVPSAQAAEQPKPATNEISDADAIAYLNAKKQKAATNEISDADAIAYLNAKKQKTAAPTETKPTPATPEPEQSILQQAGHLAGQFNKGVSDIGRGVYRGFKDVTDGLAYVLPKGVQAGADLIGADGIAKKAGDLATQISDSNKRSEDAYQAATDGSIGAGIGRVGGNLATAAIPVGAAAKTVQAASKAPLLTTALNATKNAAMGAAYGAAGTKTDEESIADNAQLGAVVGTVAPTVINRVVAPLGKAVQQGYQKITDAAGQAIDGYLPSAAQVVNATEGVSPRLKHMVELLNKYAPAGSDTARNELADKVAGKINRPIGVESNELLRQNYEHLPDAYSDFNKMTANHQVTMNEQPALTKLAEARAAYAADPLPSSKIGDAFNNVESKFAPMQVENPIKVDDLKAALAKARQSVASKEEAIAAASATMSPEMIAKHQSELAARVTARTAAEEALKNHVPHTKQPSVQSLYDTEQQAAKLAGISETLVGDNFGQKALGSQIEVLNHAIDASLSPAQKEARAAARELASRQDFARELAQALTGKKTASASALTTASKNGKKAPEDLHAMTNVINKMEALRNPTEVSNLYRMLNIGAGFSTAGAVPLSTALANTLMQSNRHGLPKLMTGNTALQKSLSGKETQAAMLASRIAALLSGKQD